MQSRAGVRVHARVVREVCVTNDATHGAGAFSNDGTFSYFEMRHPLNSGEAGGVDIALTIGQTTRIKMLLQIGSTSTTFPGSGYQSITINP